MNIPSSVALLAPLFFACGAASAQDYRAWTKLDAGGVYWYVDEASVSKVANTIFFDGYINRVPSDPIFEGAARSGVACDGSLYTVVSSPWPFEAPHKSADLSRALDSRRAMELDRNLTKIERNEKTLGFKSRLASLCKTTRKPDKNIQVVVSASSQGERTIARLNTFTKPTPKQIELWTDSVGIQKFQPMAFRDGYWRPDVKADGTPAYSEELKTERSNAAKVRYDCDRRKYVTLTLITYKDDGSVDKSSNVTPAQLASSWSEAIPDTVGEEELDFLCAL